MVQIQIWKGYDGASFLHNSAQLGNLVGFFQRSVWTIQISVIDIFYLGGFTLVYSP